MGSKESFFAQIELPKIMAVPIVVPNNHTTTLWLRAKTVDANIVKRRKTSKIRNIEIYNR